MNWSHELLILLLLGIFLYFYQYNSYLQMYIEIEVASMIEVINLNGLGCLLDHKCY